MIFLTLCVIFLRTPKFISEALGNILKHPPGCFRTDMGPSNHQVHRNAQERERA